MLTLQAQNLKPVNEKASLEMCLWRSKILLPTRNLVMIYGHVRHSINIMLPKWICLTPYQTKWIYLITNSSTFPIFQWYSWKHNLFRSKTSLLQHGVKQTNVLQKDLGWKYWSYLSFKVHIQKNIWWLDISVNNPWMAWWSH